MISLECRFPHTRLKISELGITLLYSVKVRGRNARVIEPNSLPRGRENPMDVGSQYEEVQIITSIKQTLAG